MTTTRPQISVVIPTYNRRQVLPRTIGSVLGQVESDFELIVVDDRSTDDTPAYLATLTDPRIRVVRTERNLGTAGARNVGLQAARADFVALLDDDDVYLPRRLTVPLAIFAAEPDVVCTLAAAVMRNPGRIYVQQLPDVKLAPAPFEWGLISYLFDGVSGTSMTIRRAAALEVGGFLTGLTPTDDREFLVRLARLGGGRIIAEPLWEKYWSDTGLSNDWARAGRGLVDYVKARPEYVTRFRKIGSYLATKVLISDLRRRMFVALRRDWREFRAAGLIDGNIPRMWRDHREVRRYRKAMSSREALAALTGPPEDWI